MRARTGISIPCGLAMNKRLICTQDIVTAQTMQRARKDTGAGPCGDGGTARAASLRRTTKVKLAASIFRSRHVDRNARRRCPYHVVDDHGANGCHCCGRLARNAFISRSTSASLDRNT